MRSDRARTSLDRQPWKRHPVRYTAPALLEPDAVVPANPRARLPDGGGAAGLAVLLGVTLVVLLGTVKRRGRGDLGDDLPPVRLLLGVA